MKMGNWVKLVAVVITISLSILSGCSPYVIERIKFMPPKTSETSNGLTLEIHPLGIGEAAERRELSMPFGYGGGWVFFPTPLIRVKIVNDNTHIIRFTGSVIKLVDKDRTVFNALSKRQVKIDNARSLEKFGRQLRYSPEVIENFIKHMEEEIDALSMLDSSTEILPGFSGDYYLAFDLPTKFSETEDESNAWTMQHAPFKLMLFDVNTMADQTSTKSSFEFLIPAHMFRETYQNGRLIKSE